MILEIGFVNLREEMNVSCVPVPHWCSGGNEVDAWTTEPAVVNLVHGGIYQTVGIPARIGNIFLFQIVIRYMNYVTYIPQTCYVPNIDTLQGRDTHTGDAGTKRHLFLY